jgi:ubiquitin-protein ligase
MKAPSVELVGGEDNDGGDGGGHEKSKQQEQQEEEETVVAPAITTTTTTRLPLSPTGPTSSADSFPAHATTTTITNPSEEEEEEEEQDLSPSPPPQTTTTTTTTTTITNPRRLSSTNTTGHHEENFSPHTIKRLQKEILSLHTSPSEGITFIPNDEETLMEVHAEITGPEDTPYEGGIFKVKLLLSNNHPHTPPRAFFLTKIFHPNVAMNGSGDVCVDVLKRGWTAEVTLAHVLQVCMCMSVYVGVGESIKLEWSG